jgi:VanZ family protein
MLHAFRLNRLLAARIAAWFLATMIVALSVVSPDLRPETGVPHDLEHFLIYAATGLAFGMGYERKRIPVALLLLIFTAAVEIAQLFVPGRHARVSDFIVDAVAMCAGLVVASLTGRILSRFDFKLDV